MLKIKTLEDTIEEARRQINVCNACRYCEGYCAVFPAISQKREFANADITQLANLCHNCRGCYYACQYTPPHEFSINLPRSLAEVRQQSWQHFAAPSFIAGIFHRHGSALAAAVILGLSLFIYLFQTLIPASGDGFYKIVAHNVLVAIFVPAFLLPILSIAVSLRRYWLSIGGQSIRYADLRSAISSAASMKNLSGGAGDGCNFEDEDRFSNTRRWLHHAVMYGFLLCFAATSAGTILHYVFDMPAPYGLFSLPKLFGLSGGILLCIGTAGLARLKLNADRNLSDANVWGGEMGFILLLFFVSASGLALYLLGNTSWLAPLLAAHLGSVLAFFLLMPFSKMVHGFYRIMALIRNSQTSG